MLVLTLVLLSSLTAAAAQAVVESPADTTAAEIQRERQRKLRTLRPETLPWLHRTILYVRQNRIPEKITYGYKGIRPRFGTLGPGSGFGTGIEYYRPNLSDERYSVRSSVTGSLLQFFMVDAEFGARRIGGAGFANVLAFHRFSPSMDFYGVGPQSSLANLTAYSLEENNIEFAGGWELSRRLRVGGVARYFTASIGRSRRTDRPSSEQFFGPAALPGVVNESPYIETGGFIEFRPPQGLGVPPGGTQAAVRLSRFAARRSNGISFTRLDAFAERNQLFLNQQRAFVLRARASLNAPSGAAAIPFYLQPQLGGPNDLRGYAGRRFYDNNHAVVTAEYQWQIFSGVWLAAFSDAGKAFPQWDRWSLRSTRTSYGVGLRFGGSGMGAGRFDFAFSREGSQFWVVFATF